eukprot:scaffold8132_cov85-Isochrysis_galbana.AAC.2
MGLLFSLLLPAAAPPPVASPLCRAAVGPAAGRTARRGSDQAVATCPVPHPSARPMHAHSPAGSFRTG